MLGAIEAADLNNDGLIDLAVCNQAISGSMDLAPFFIFLNLGHSNQFATNHLFDLFSGYISVVIGDFDNDGRKNDIAACTDGSVLNVFQSVDYTRPYVWDYRVYFPFGRSSSLIEGKFNADEFADLAFISSDTDTLQVLLGYEDGTFMQQIYPTISNPTAVARINFNNDQIDDLAVINCNRTLSVFLGTSIGLFDRNYLSFETGYGNNTQCAHSLKVADLNQDGRDDLILIDAETQSVGIILGKNCYD